MKTRLRIDDPEKEIVAVKSHKTQNVANKGKLYNTISKKLFYPSSVCKNLGPDDKLMQEL